MKSLLVICTLLFVSGTLATTKVSDIWSNCGKQGDHVTIKTIKIVPDPPQIGQNVTVFGSGLLDETVTDGQVFVSLYFGPILLVNNTYDLCKLIAQYRHCPLSKGPITFGVSQPIPSEAPSGAYTGNIVAVDQNGQEMFCIALSFTLGGSTKPQTHYVKSPHN